MRVDQADIECALAGAWMTAVLWSLILFLMMRRQLRADGVLQPARRPTVVNEGDEDAATRESEVTESLNIEMEPTVAKSIICVREGKKQFKYNNL